LASIRFVRPPGAAILGSFSHMGIGKWSGCNRLSFVAAFAAPTRVIAFGQRSGEETIFYEYI